MINACTKLRDFARGQEITQRILTDNDPRLVQNANLVTTMIDMLVSLRVIGAHLGYVCSPLGQSWRSCSALHSFVQFDSVEEADASAL